VQYEIEIGGKVRQVVVHRSDGTFLVAVDGTEQAVDAVRVDAHTWSLLLDGRSVEATIASSGPAGSFAVDVDATTVSASLNGRRRWGRREDGASRSGPQRVVAPMPGKVLRVLAKPGDRVTARQPLVVIEAMKMENELRAPADGRVVEVHAVEGQSVDAGALLVVLVGSD